LGCYNNKSHHLCGVRQDCLIHQGQEGEIHIQEPRCESSCSPEAILSTRRAPKKKNNRNNRRWRRTKHAPAEITQLITALNIENDHMLPKPFPIKRGDPGVPIIECTIKNTTFPHTICDTGSGYNLMSKQLVFTRLNQWCVLVYLCREIIVDFLFFLIIW